MNTNPATGKKITLATVKSFIKKNLGKGLMIDRRSRFDGMTDCVESIQGHKFEVATPATVFHDDTQGVNGAWFVGGSRNYFDFYTDSDGMEGFSVWNCCGSFVLAIKK